MRVGGGAHTYTWIEGWARLPGGVRFGYTHGVVVDGRDNVYVHNRSRDAVAVFDRDGRFLGSWGEEFAAGAHGLHLSREGGREFLYLADPVRHLVAKATLDGDVLWRLGPPERAGLYEKEEQYKPTDVAVAPDGSLYVSDGYGRGFVHHYGPDGGWIRSWGGRGAEAGRLDCPHGIWVDARPAQPLLLVADRGNRRLQTFTLQGEHLGFVTGGMRQPCGFPPLRRRPGRPGPARLRHDSRSGQPRGRLPRRWCPRLGGAGVAERPGRPPRARAFHLAARRVCRLPRRHLRRGVDRRRPSDQAGACVGSRRRCHFSLPAGGRANRTEARHVASRAFQRPFPARPRVTAVHPWDVGLDGLEWAWSGTPPADGCGTP